MESQVLETPRKMKVEADLQRIKSKGREVREIEGSRNWYSIVRMSCIARRTKYYLCILQFSLNWTVQEFNFTLIEAFFPFFLRQSRRTPLISVDFYWSKSLFSPYIEKVAMFTSFVNVEECLSDRVHFKSFWQQTDVFGVRLLYASPKSKRYSPHISTVQLSPFIYSKCICW